MLETLLTPIAVLASIILFFMALFIVVAIASKITDFFNEINDEVEYRKRMALEELEAKENKRRCENIKKMFPEKYEEYKKKGLMK